ncbi:MAG TPA: TolC family protein [Flavisolibacter sp.]|nr:TolC family protein [Flavisolibacter sp.]
MFYKNILFTCCLVLSFFSKAQTKWSLRSCIDYAVKNNISIKEADVQKRLAELDLLQNKASFWPSLSFSGSSGYRFGLSENPTTGILQSNSFFSTGFSLTANVTLFNWFSKRHTLRAVQAAADAEKQAAKKAENDVVLNVSAAYLQVLLAAEMKASALLQLKQTLAQAKAMHKKIRMGVLSELDAAQMQLQLMTDSTSLLERQQAEAKALLQLKAVLNLNADLQMELETVDVANDGVDQLIQINAPLLVASAIENLPQIRDLQYQINAVKERTVAAQAVRYPALSLYGSTASNFVNIPSAQSYVFIPQETTGSIVNINGVSYDVMSPSYKVETIGVTPFFRQLHKNFGQNIGISISIPIMNGKTFVTNQKREALSLTRLQLQKEKLQQEIQTEIYTAFLEAKAAYRKAGMLKSSVEAATKALHAAQKRYDVNLLSTQDLLLAQTALQKAEIELLASQYELTFKIYLLNFYQVASK